MIDNEGRLALVMGVRDKRSLAWACAKKLHESGCLVFLTFMDDTESQVKKLMRSEGMDEALSCKVDVRSEEDMKNARDKIRENTGMVISYFLHAVAYGSHNVLCTGGAGEPDHNPDRFLNIPFYDLVESWDVSAYSLLRAARVFKDDFAEGSSIVSLTYNASQRVYEEYAGMSTSKALLESFSMLLANHMAEFGVRVNAVSPGAVRTTSLQGIRGNRAMLKESNSNSPLGNVSHEDVARAVLFYCSEMSNGMTGNVHYVDGGLNIVGTRKKRAE